MEKSVKASKSINITESAATIRITQFTGTTSHLLDHLTTHTDNIRTYINEGDRTKVGKERINAERIVGQLNNLVDELKDFRNQIDQSKHLKFDKSTEPHLKLILVATKQYRELLREFQLQNNTKTDNKQPSSHESNEDYHNLQTMRVNDWALFEEECQNAQSQLDSVEHIEEEIKDIHDLYNKLGEYVHTQGETINTVENNIEETAENVSSARTSLAKAEKYKAVWYPVTGAVIGACVGGPIGLAVGIKVACVALIGGSALGFTGGRILKKKKDASIVVDPIVSNLGGVRPYLD